MHAHLRLSTLRTEDADRWGKLKSANRAIEKLVRAYDLVSITNGPNEI